MTITPLNATETRLNIICKNHNLANIDYVLVESVQGITNVNGKIAQVIFVDVDTIQLDIVHDAGSAPAGTYTGGGVLSRVTPPDMLTKQFNFFTAQDRNTYIEQVKFLVDRTSNGEFQVDFYGAFSRYDLGVAGNDSGAALSTYIVETRPYSVGTFEDLQNQLWHWIYLQGDASTIQLRLYLNNLQTITKNIAHSNFQLHAMLFYAMPTRELESGL